MSESRIIRRTTYDYTIGNITFENFPIIDEIYALRNDAIRNFITFLKYIGLGTLEQINDAINRHHDVDRVKTLLLRQDIDAVSEKENAKNVDNFEKMQKTILGNGNNPRYINVLDVYSRVQKIHRFEPESVIRELIYGKKEEPAVKKEEEKTDEMGRKNRRAGRKAAKRSEALANLLTGKPSQSEATEGSATEPPKPTEDSPVAEAISDTKNSVAEVTTDDTDSGVEKITKTPKEENNMAKPEKPAEPINNIDGNNQNTQLARIRNFDEARKTPGYLEALAKAFPKVPYAIMRQHLWCEQPQLPVVCLAFKEAGVDRSGRRKMSKAERRAEEGVFVSWVNGGEIPKAIGPDSTVNETTTASSQPAKTDEAEPDTPKAATTTVKRVAISPVPQKTGESDVAPEIPLADDGTKPAPASIAKDNPDTSERYSAMFCISATSERAIDEIFDYIVEKKKAGAIHLDAYTCSEE